MSLRCAVGDTVRRGNAQAAREHRPPAYHKRMLYDEGFTLGGRESTSDANQWAVKTLARHPASQAKLRSALLEVLPAAAAERRAPTADEVARVRCPYLDASFEELFQAYLQMRMLVVLVVWSFCLEEVPAELDTNGAWDKLTRESHDCYVRLTALSL
ncbi:hypothetical protein RB595_005913 [Gaeumannomyces hyphopodioides]